MIGKRKHGMGGPLTQLDEYPAMCNLDRIIKKALALTARRGGLTIACGEWRTALSHQVNAKPDKEIIYVFERKRKQYN